jgi:hypothetical protein
VTAGGGRDSGTDVFFHFGLLGLGGFAGDRFHLYSRVLEHEGALLARHLVLQVQRQVVQVSDVGGCENERESDCGRSMVPDTGTHAGISIGIGSSGTGTTITTAPTAHKYTKEKKVTF